MTQQEKLIALCQYLPYGVKIQWDDTKDIWGINFFDETDYVHTLYPLSTLVFTLQNQPSRFDVGWKLILRPLSSMTEKERVEMMEHGPTKIFAGKGIDDKWYVCELMQPENPCPIPEQCRQWLLSKHFDLFGLIEKQFAVEKR